MHHSLAGLTPAIKGEPPKSSRTRHHSSDVAHHCQVKMLTPWCGGLTSWGINLRDMRALAGNSVWEAFETTHITSPVPTGYLDDMNQGVSVVQVIQI